MTQISASIMASTFTNSCEPQNRNDLQSCSTCTLAESRHCHLCGLQYADCTELVDVIVFDPPKRPDSSPLRTPKSTKIYG